MNRKELNPGSSPQAAFGARLRSLREARGWRQEDLSEHMGYASTHISSVETGRKLSTLRFARSADRTFGTGDASDSFERQWREIRHGTMLAGTPEYLGFEGRASEIRLYEVGVIPGLLQTPEYAAAVAGRDVRRGAITSKQADERVTLIAERQATLDRTPPPLVSVVLDESCLRWPVGGPALMEAQLARLVEFAALPNTMLQIAPFVMGDRRPIDLPVYLLTLLDRSIVSYAESALRGTLERESTFALPLLTAYHLLQAEALSQAESVAMINRLRKGTP